MKLQFNVINWKYSSQRRSSLQRDFTLFSLAYASTQTQRKQNNQMILTSYHSPPFIPFPHASIFFHWLETLGPMSNILEPMRIKPVTLTVGYIYYFKKIPTVEHVDYFHEADIFESLSTLQNGYFSGI